MTALKQLAYWRSNSEDKRGKLPLPPALYTSTEIHKLEMEKIFNKEWICTGHISQLKSKGDYLTIDIAGHPVIVIREDEDNIKTYSNVCAHRSSRLLDGAGNTKLIVCPYHAWAYNLNGTLRGAPYMKKEQIENICLNELRSEIWNGLIFVNLDDNAAPLAPRLLGLNEHINKFNAASMQVVHCYDGEVDCNWKVLVENFCESFHLFRVHKTTLEPDTPAASTIVMPAGEGYNHHTLDIISGKHLIGDGPPDKDHLCGIYPTTTLSISSAWAIWLSIIPLARNRLKFRAWIARDISDGQQATINDGELERILAFMGEDKIINDGVQQGLEAGVGNKGPLHEFERTNWDFAHYYANILLDE